MRTPELYLIRLVFQQIEIMNHFPIKRVISDTISPTTIIKGKIIHYKKDIGPQIGHYCQVHEDKTPCSSNKPCTKGAIYMVPSINMQGGFIFMSLR